MAAEHQPPHRPAGLLHQAFAQHLVNRFRRDAVGQQVQAAAGEQDRIALPRRHEVFQPQGPVLRRTQGIEFVGVEHDVLVAAIFVALDDGGGIDGAMHRAVLGVADALAAVGMKLMKVTDLAAGHGRVGLDRRVDQAELEKSRPTGPAAGDGGRAEKRLGRGDIGGNRMVHGRSRNREIEAAGLLPESKFPQSTFVC